MGTLRHIPTLAAASIIFSGVALGWPAASPAGAETFLDEAGEITPAEATYRFDGSAGETVTIILNSDDFDPVLSLLDSSGSEIATNDDFGGSLNSTIILELPADGTYTVIAKSFSGQGGNFDLTVRTSTDYETVYATGQNLVAQEDFAGAIAAYTEAIELDPQEPSAYLGRAEANLGQIYLTEGEAIQGPEDIPMEVREAVINDFEKAADLIEIDGPQGWADTLREQADFLRNAGATDDPSI
jgi:tetratricopeptide (TPR) repeat protein